MEMIEKTSSVRPNSFFCVTSYSLLDSRYTFDLLERIIFKPKLPLPLSGGPLDHSSDRIKLTNKRSQFWQVAVSGCAGIFIFFHSQTQMRKMLVSISRSKMCDFFFLSFFSLCAREKKNDSSIGWTITCIRERLFPHLGYNGIAPI